MLDYNPLSRHLNITNRENSNPSETQVQYCVHLRVVLTQAILFLKSISERGGSDTEGLD